MQDTTYLLRQVHPQWFKNGHVMSVAFRPTAKDAGLLSVYDGDQTSTKQSWLHYTQTLSLKSAGVWGVTVAECANCKLPARPDPQPGFPEHAVIDFAALVKKDQGTQSKILATIAEERGCLYAAPE